MKLNEDNNMSAGELLRLMIPARTLIDGCTTAVEKMERIKTAFAIAELAARGVRKLIDSGSIKSAGDLAGYMLNTHPAMLSILVLSTLVIEKNENHNQSN